jgi:hypothetical protein
MEIVKEMLLKQTTRLALWLSISIGMVACDSNHSTPVGPIVAPPEQLPHGPFLVSTAMTPPAQIPDAQIAAVMGGTVVYISLPPGVIAGGKEARIQSVEGGTQFVSFIDGGFDPVQVAAGAGDVITLDVYLNGSSVPTAYSVTVPAVSHPTLVRTNPPLHNSVVPLNARPIVVFSEPIDASSLTSQAIRVQQGGATLAGILSFGDLSRTSVVFSPANSLELSSDYDFIVTSSVRNSHGAGLDSTVVVPFTTTSVAPPTPEPLRLVSSTPLDGGQDVRYYKTVLELWFNEPVDFSTVLGGTSGKRVLLLSGIDTIAGEVRCVGINNASCASLQFLPLQPLRAGESFQLVVSAGIKGASGATLRADTVVQFSTMAPPPNGLAAQVSVISFQMIEFRYPGYDQWYYAPLVIIAEISGRAQAFIDKITFDFSALGQGSFPAYCPRSLTLQPGAGVDMFKESYGEYQVIYYTQGRAGAGSTATATVFYHDEHGEPGRISATVPITAGELPNTYTGGESATTYDGCRP